MARGSAVVGRFSAGERAHYELALGNRAEAERLLGVMEAQAGTGGLISEQVWDAPDIADRELFNGRPSGSAMPLVWAHAEYVKLLRSLREGQVFDTPPQPVKRYQVDKNRVSSCHLALQSQVSRHPGRQGPPNRGAGSRHGPLERRRVAHGT